MTFKNRTDAGKILASNLAKYKNSGSIVFALPRGGVPVGYEVATSLNIPLTVLVSRKIGAPNNPEFGIGAISENNTMVLDKELVRRLSISQQSIEALEQKEKRELLRRVDEYREGRDLPNLKGKTAIVVDDGLATGVTAIAAVEAVKKQNPDRLIFAIPVCAEETAEKIKERVDEFYCNYTPTLLRAIGLYYEDFRQVSDSEVIELLEKAEEEARYSKNNANNHYLLN